MSMVTRETSGLKASVDGKGRIRLFHRGECLPLSAITVDSGSVGERERGTMSLTLLTQFVTFTHKED
tara:strand:+ start:19249 stop:19449 length:201 start_codon:yes stop_codon:yes gene_type:complete